MVIEKTTPLYASTKPSSPTMVIVLTNPLYASTKTIFPFYGHRKYITAVSKRKSHLPLSMAIESPTPL